MKLSVCRSFKFSYGHYLPGHSKCKNQHGHNATMEIEVSSDEEATERGMIIDFGLLKDIVNNLIIDNLDHKNLNDISLFQGVVPTAENICLYVFGRLTKYFHNHDGIFILERVRIYETDDCYAEVRVDT